MQQIWSQVSHTLHCSKTTANMHSHPSERLTIACCPDVEGNVQYSSPCVHRETRFWGERQCLAAPGSAYAPTRKSSRFLGLGHPLAQATPMAVEGRVHEHVKIASRHSNASSAHRLPMVTSSLFRSPKVCSKILQPNSFSNLSDVLFYHSPASLCVCIAPDHRPPSHDP